MVIIAHSNVILKKLNEYIKFLLVGDEEHHFNSENNSRHD